jgi:hypothetical protein
MKKLFVCVISFFVFNSTFTIKHVYALSPGYFVDPQSVGNNIELIPTPTPTSFSRIHAVLDSPLVTDTPSHQLIIPTDISIPNIIVPTNTPAVIRLQYATPAQIILDKSVGTAGDPSQGSDSQALGVTIYPQNTPNSTSVTDGFGRAIDDSTASTQSPTLLSGWKVDQKDLLVYFFGGIAILFILEKILSYVFRSKKQVQIEKQSTDTIHSTDETTPLKVDDK